MSWNTAWCVKIPPQWSRLYAACGIQPGDTTNTWLALNFFLWGTAPPCDPNWLIKIFYWPDGKIFLDIDTETASRVWEWCCAELEPEGSIDPIIWNSGCLQLCLHPLDFLVQWTKKVSFSICSSWEFQSSSTKRTLANTSKRDNFASTSYPCIDSHWKRKLRGVLIGGGSQI